MMQEVDMMMLDKVRLLKVILTLPSQHNSPPGLASCPGIEKEGSKGKEAGPHDERASNC